eukprot:TRINITY_DN6452_c0_g3_i2.p1 TRINITY_DN6452_c0_g3~~TRINITY_DN6452_c0_g3_i2.p1  ORF type:complete len:203 (-),score=44.15 TRINITY_DN6452_c0_g3_i2:1783-2331(-)
MSLNTENSAKSKKGAVHSNKDKASAKTAKARANAVGRTNEVVESPEFECEFIQEKLYLEEVFNTLYLSFESPAHSANAMQYMQMLQQVRINAAQSKPLQAGLSQEQALQDTEQAKEENKLPPAKSEAPPASAEQTEESKKPIPIRINNKYLSQAKKNTNKPKVEKPNTENDPNIYVTRIDTK